GASHRAAALGIAAEVADFLLQLRAADPAAFGLLLEKCLELRVLDRVDAGAEALLAVLAGLDQIVKSADDIVAVHRPNPPLSAARGAGCLVKKRLEGHGRSDSGILAGSSPLIAMSGLKLGRGDHGAPRRSRFVR